MPVAIASKYQANSWQTADITEHGRREKSMSMLSRHGPGAATHQPLSSIINTIKIENPINEN